ncbi:hypothetical protein AXX17_AT2G07560 [Arabidopsis thaliana]|uniref:Uncharacterized protein n=1 Tax=Arabidopsis thaliana TaxID=3702 RepID=A0A178W099_ARATH|nr:hypothetical protein AXX17_AT2G07560 [Arabidopsis thaliana]
MSSENDYTRYLSTQHVLVPSAHASRSQGNASRNCDPPSPTSQNQQAGFSPPPSNSNTPNQSHSATQPPTSRLNDLTLDELLRQPLPFLLSMLVIVELLKRRRERKEMKDNCEEDERKRRRRTIRGGGEEIITTAKERH